MNRVDPYRDHRFSVEIDGLVSTGFTEVDGLTVTAGVFADPDDVPEDPPEDREGRRRVGGVFGDISGAIEAAREAAADAVDRATWIDPDDWPTIVNWTEPGTANPPPRQRRAEFPLLTLRRGVTDSRSLEDWIAEWIAGESQQRNVRILLLDSDGREARGWECRGAVPVRWSGPSLRADRGGVATEAIEIAHAGIEPLNMA
ncbi:MAG: phage tail protein [Salinirussus sp.]